MSALPGILAEIAEVAGEAAALQLARTLGGTELKVSGRPKGALAKVVGATAAAKIAAALGPTKILVPMASARGQRGRREQVAKMLAEGASARQAALACDVHTRTVERVSRKVRESDAPLFDRAAEDA